MTVIFVVGVYSHSIVTVLRNPFSDFQVLVIARQNSPAAAAQEKNSSFTQFDRNGVILRTKSSNRETHKPHKHYRGIFIVI